MAKQHGVAGRMRQRRLLGVAGQRRKEAEAPVLQPLESGTRGGLLRKVLAFQAQMWWHALKIPV